MESIADACLEVMAPGDKGARLLEELGLLAAAQDAGQSGGSG